MPPLDGSKILYVWLENRPDILGWLEQYGFYLLIALMVFGGGILRLASIPGVWLVNALAGPEVLYQVISNSL